MHQKYQDVSEVGLFTSWVMQFKIVLGFQQEKSAELDEEFGNKLYVYTNTHTQYVCNIYIYIMDGPAKL